VFKVQRFWGLKVHGSMVKKFKNSKSKYQMKLKTPMPILI